MTSARGSIAGVTFSGEVVATPVFIGPLEASGSSVVSLIDAANVTDALAGDGAAIISANSCIVTECSEPRGVSPTCICSPSFTSAVGKVLAIFAVGISLVWELTSSKSRAVPFGFLSSMGIVTR